MRIQQGVGEEFPEREPQELRWLEWWVEWGTVTGGGIEQVGTCQIREGLLSAGWQFGLFAAGSRETWESIGEARDLTRLYFKNYLGRAVKSGSLGGKKGSWETR